MDCKFACGVCVLLRVLDNCAVHTLWGGQPLSGHKVLLSALSHADVVVNSFMKWYFDDACVFIIFSSFRMICAC